MRFFFLISLAFGALHAQKSPDLYAEGKTLYFQNGCAGCHGSRAEGSGNNPLLANRAKGFLAYKLKRFRDGIADTSLQAVMVGFAKPLTDADIDAIATFLHDFHDAQTERYDPAYQQWGDGGS